MRRLMNRPRGNAWHKTGSWMSGLSSAFLLVISVAVLWYGGRIGGMDSHATSPLTRTDSSIHPVSSVTFSGQTVSNQIEERISTMLATFVPQIEEVYLRKLTDGGVAIYAVASLGDLTDAASICDDIVSQFLLASYEDLPFTRVDYATLYIKSNGHYVMAAGLGKDAARRMAVTAFAADQGVLLTRQLAHMDDVGTALEAQAFAEYNPLG